MFICIFFNNVKILSCAFRGNSSLIKPCELCTVFTKNVFLSLFFKYPPLFGRRPRGRSRSRSLFAFHSPPPPFPLPSPPPKRLRPSSPPLSPAKGGGEAAKERWGGEGFRQRKKEGWLKPQGINGEGPLFFDVVFFGSTPPYSQSEQNAKKTFFKAGKQ